MDNIKNSISTEKIQKYRLLNKKAKYASQDFEAYFVSMLLNSMTKGLYKSSVLGENKANKIFRGMYFDQLSKEISKKSDFGIEENVYQEMVNKEIPSSVLEKLKHINNKNYGFTKIKLTDKQIKGKIYQVVEDSSKKYGVDKSIILGIINAESSFNPMAKSGKGAKGLMQLMDDTAKELGVKNVWSIEDNINAGTKYYKQLYNSLGSKEMALAAYNAGIGNVRKYGGVPPFKETKQYVDKVIKYSEKLKKE